ncbi:MAG: hypothetical protein ACR2NP_23085 [Pirellulaceae bacterium]
MTKTLLLAALIAFVWCPAIVSAQSANKEELNEDQLHEITITPAAPARPALQYRLYPDRLKMIDRNAALYYHRAVRSMQATNAQIQRHNQKRPGGIPDLYDDYDAWMRVPLSEMPVDDMREWLVLFQDVIDEVERAALSRNCEWGILPDRGEDIDWVMLQLEEIQYMRSINRMLGVAIRLAAHEGDFEKVTRYLQMGYKIANDVATCGTLVSGLVGVACANVMNEQLVMLVQLDGSPNFYWPLVDLPDPICDMRSGARVEMGMLSSSASPFRLMQDPLNQSLSAAGWREALSSDTEKMESYGVGAPLAGVGFFVIRAYPVARQALLDAGFDRAQVDRMPVIQVVAAQQQRMNDMLTDEVLKTLHLPYAEMLEQLDQYEGFLETSSMVYPPSTKTNLLPFFELLWPALPNVLHAEARTTRHMAALRTIEAIRAHAADTGVLPESLQEIEVVPVPNNPATGQPFEYRLNRDGAELLDYGFAKYSWNHFQIRLAQ